MNDVYIEERRPSHGSNKHKPKAPVDPYDTDDGGAGFYRVLRKKEELMTKGNVYDARTILAS
jgi:hypothetical protein